MTAVVGEIAAAVAAVFGLLTILWTQWLSPKAKRRREAMEKGQEAAEDLDSSGVTAFFDKLRRK